MKTIKGSVLFSVAFTFVFLFMYQDISAHTPPAEKKASRSKAASRIATPEIAYTVSMTKPWTHMLEVEMRIKFNAAQNHVELKMPVWTPGSYLVREYARHVQDFEVMNAAGGALVWQKINKNTWQIEAKSAKQIVAKYRVYSNELTVRTNELNSEHAFWNNAALLMFPKGHLKASSTVKVNPYGNWKVATGLRPVAGQANTFRADDFDILYDSPFEVSDYKEIKFEAAGKPHRIIVTGDGNYDLKQMAVDTAKIADESVKIFGEMPTEDYLIIINLRGGGGLEHLNSTALQWNRFGFKPRASYVRFLSLVAHEYFHLWNVKRIRPDALGPFDYENENYTRLLWVAEGTTSYYEGVLLQRAGISTPQEILDTKASIIGALQNRPGRFETSLEESSLDAWIKYYRQDQNSINNQISYYDKGEIVSMLLDLTIRQRSGGNRSLDDVLKALYVDFYKKGKNYTPTDFQRLCEQMAGSSLNDFFTKYVNGRSELDYRSAFNTLGLDLVESRPNSGRAYIGANLGEDAGRLMVRSVPMGTPAYDQGLNFNDQIVAIDGYRASQAFLQTYLNGKKPKDKVSLSVFRFDRLETIELTLGSNETTDYNFEILSNVSQDQRDQYRKYFGADID